MKKFFVVVVASAVALTSANAGKKNRSSEGNVPRAAAPSSNAPRGGGGTGYRSSTRGMYSASLPNRIPAGHEQAWGNRFNNTSGNSHHHHFDSDLANHATAGSTKLNHVGSAQHAGNHSNLNAIRNWKGNRIAFADACRRHHREWHGCNWWRRHYTVVFVNFGWYFWDAGWWYPAWGYDPYNAYSYDTPLYSDYDGSPDTSYAADEATSIDESSGGNFNNREVVMRVQTELKRAGYYYGDADGDLGPITKAAIANYQRDHGLAVNATIDAATLRQIGGQRVASSSSD